MKSLASASTESLTSLDKKMTRREEVTRMLEERKREKEENLTFRPALTKSNSSNNVMDERSIDERFEKLYNEAKKRQETRKELNYSFKPTINAKSQRRSSTPDALTQRLYEAPGAGKPRRSASAEKSRQRSFSPQITSRARAIERGGTQSSPTSRLYKQAQAMKENKEALASKINRESSKECTFKPKTNKDVKSPNGGVPLEQRMEKYVAMREKRLQDLKEKQLAQEAEKATFKPTSYTKSRPKSPSVERMEVSKTTSKPQRSRTPTKNESAVGTVFDRLANATPRKSKEVVHVDKDEKELTFKPKLVSKRSASPLREQESSKYGSVHNRLYQKGNEQRMESLAKKEEIRKEMEKEHTFAPTVPLGHRSNPGSPTKEAVFERLSASRQYVHEILSQVKTEFELDNCTFSPEINKVSDELGSKKQSEPAYLRLSAEAKRLREQNEKLRAKKKDEELVGCTFAPNIDKNSTKVVTSKRANNKKESVFDRLASSSDKDKESPPIQENRPANVPKVIRRSTIEKLVQSKGVIKESGSPTKVKEAQSPQIDCDNEDQNEELINDKLVPISPIAVPNHQKSDVPNDFFPDEF